MSATPTAPLPTFRTERLLLRPRTLADLDDCLGMDRDSEVGRFVPGPWDDPESHRAFVLGRMATAFPPGLGYWTVVERRAPDRFLGWIMLTPLTERGTEVEIGWRFTPKARGRGHATEAARPVLAHAFATVGLPAVVADIDPANARSVRVAQKLGMRVEARSPSSVRYVASPEPGVRA
jgi:RimJ/RimL family protein N-acetyltransferase